VSLRNPLAPLAGLVVVIVAAALVSLAVAGHVVAIAIAGGVIAYGLFIWQTQRLRDFERSVEGEDD
jgi:hypothetical protein